MNSTSKEFAPTQMISRVVLVGCGGTGSVWASAICRIIYDLSERGQHIPELWFVDHDKVEHKNVGRQMFVESEIGRYKADVLARRFNLSLGLNIQWFAEPFDAQKHAHVSTLLCGAVDNHLARRALARANCTWIDAGNHRTAGQVIVGNTDKAHAVVSAFKAARVAYLPNAALLFPSLLEPEPIQQEQPQPDLSCADLVVRGEQHLLINTLMASVAAQYTYLLLNHEPVKSFMTYVDGETLSMRSIPVSLEDLSVYLPTFDREVA